MPVLRFAHNQGQFHLSDELEFIKPSCFGVRVIKKNGETPYFPWRGFIERKLAQRIPGARPVKLDISAYKLSDEWIAGEWVSLREDQAIQGCLIGGVVFGVTENGVPRKVQKRFLSGT